MRGAFFNDLRFAARIMRRSPTFSAAIVLTLALGIGASTAIFSTVYGVLFRPLPYRDAERLVVIRTERVLEGAQRPIRSFFPLGDLAELQSGTRVFDSVAFYATEQLVLTHGGFTEKVNSAWVSESFFAAIGGRLESGRALAASAGDRGSVVISHRLRERLFGEDNAIGRALTIGHRTAGTESERSYEIIGIAHQTFQLPAQNTDLWIPAIELTCCSYAAIARLKLGVSEMQAATDVNVVVSALAAKNPRLYAGAQAAVVALRDELTRNVRLALWVLLGSVGLLLGVACANVTNLLFTRNAARSRDTAVRIALGASRGRLCLQSLAESVLAVTAAAGLGMLIALGVINALISLGPATLPRLDAENVRIDGPVFSFALSVAGATTVVMGFLPVIMSGNLVDALKTGTPEMSAGPRSRRLQNGLVIVQLALSIVLLVGASLLGRSLVRLMTTDIGVRTDRVAAGAINLSYQRRVTDAQQTTLVDRIVERVRTLPNVQAAGAGASLPPNASTIRLTLKRFGDTVDYQATAVPATPGYFSALGVKLLKGRLFSEADAATSNEVMIMSEDTARRFFGVEDPIGRTMSLPVLRSGTAGTAEMTLVGVVGNVKHSGLEAAPDDTVYRPLRQQPWPLLFVVARTNAHAGVLASSLRREIAAIDPAIAISSVTTLDAIVATEAAQPRFRTALLTALATLTMAIAAVGLYGVVAQTVSRRTKEFGVRMVLGASRLDVLTLVFVDGLKLVAAGVALGLAGALAATRILAGLLYGIAPTDWISFALASGLLLLVSALATYLPARRAAHLNPIAAVRAE